MQLRAVPPNGRVSATMKDRQDNDPLGFGTEIDAVGEMLRRYASHVFVQDGMELGLFGGECDTPIDLGDEGNAEIQALGLIPGCGFYELRPGGTVKRNGKGHRPMRASADALTSSHAMTSSGCAK
jgi:hypothetical protein